MFRLVTRLHACEPEIKTFSAQSTASVKIRFTQRDRKRSLPVMLPDLETVIVELQLEKKHSRGCFKNLAHGFEGTQWFLCCQVERRHEVLDSAHFSTACHRLCGRQRAAARQDENMLILCSYNILSSETDIKAADLHMHWWFCWMQHFSHQISIFKINVQCAVITEWTEPRLLVSTMKN